MFRTTAVTVPVTALPVAVTVASESESTAHIATGWQTSESAVTLRVRLTGTMTAPVSFKLRLRQVTSA
jgi:hypothetical protein